ncbi:MAG: hypothetical protein HYV08_09250 [Deltaproteobacteria bacterium]|nr:hypothetical protein [Deltaproteobacteria bacterium]
MAEPPSDDARPSLRAFVTLLLLLGGLGLLVLFWAAQTVPRQYPPELLELRAYALELAGQLRRGEIDGTRFHALLKQRARITRERLRLPSHGPGEPGIHGGGAAPEGPKGARPGRSG